MSTMIIQAILLASLFFLVKYIEKKLRETQTNIKQIIRDSILVGACYLGMVFISEQIQPIMNYDKSQINVFTSEPDF